MKKKTRFKKWLPVITGVALTAALLSGMAYRYSTMLTNGDFIRFHVIANSDSEQDQALKLKVRDRVIEEINKGLEERAAEAAEAGIGEARVYIREKLENIELLAEETVRKEGCDYDVTAEYGVCWIPEKTYGSVTFPAGNYEALRLIIGKGEGHNWWCVLYPPLCLIDTGSSDTDSEILKDVVTSDKYSALMEQAANGSHTRVLHLRFKSAEWLQRALE